MSDNTDKRTATQRIEDLEKVLSAVCNGLNQLQGAVNNLFQSSQELPMVKEALKILDRKIEGVITNAKAETGISTEAVRDYVTNLAVGDLQQQVEAYLTNGKLTQTASGEVSNDSFCVCQELNPDGSLHNPRVQFRMDAQSKETQAALLGKKAGDTVSFGEGQFLLKLLETYTVSSETAALALSSETPAAPAETAPEDTETAPTTAAQTGPSNANFESAPAETPVATFASDAGSVAAPATAS